MLYQVPNPGQLDPQITIDLGRVAEYCPFCDRIEPHRILLIAAIRLSLFGNRDPKPRGHLGICQRCGVETDFVLDDYTTSIDDPEADLAALIARTNPDVEGRLDLRRASEARAREGGSSLDERLELIREPFDWLEHTAKREHRTTSPHPDWLSLVALLCSPIGLVLAAVAPPAPIWLGSLLNGAAILVFLAILTFVAWRMLTASRRKARALLTPVALNFIQGYRPTYDELAMVHRDLLADRLMIASVLRPDHLWNALSRREHRLNHHG